MDPVSVPVCHFFGWLTLALMCGGIFCCGVDGVGGELLSTYQRVVSHYVQLHVLGCAPSVPFNLTVDKSRQEHGYTQHIRLYHITLYYTISILFFLFYSRWNRIWPHVTTSGTLTWLWHGEETQVVSMTLIATPPEVKYSGLLANHLELKEPLWTRGETFNSSCPYSTLLGRPWPWWPRLFTDSFTIRPTRSWQLDSAMGRE